LQFLKFLDRWTVDHMLYTFKAKIKTYTVFIWAQNLGFGNNFYQNNRANLNVNIFILETFHLKLKSFSTGAWSSS